MQKNQNIRYRDMKQFDENRFKEALSQAPWDTVFVFDEIDDMLDSWESLFNSVLDENCPWREKRVLDFCLPTIQPFLKFFFKDYFFSG